MNNIPSTNVVSFKSARHFNIENQWMEFIKEKSYHHSNLVRKKGFAKIQ